MTLFTKSQIYFNGPYDKELQLLDSMNLHDDWYKISSSFSIANCVKITTHVTIGTDALTQAGDPEYIHKLPPPHNDHPLHVNHHFL